MKRNKLEEEKRKKYNANDLFKSKIELNKNNKIQKGLVKYKDSIFEKVKK